MVYPKDYTEYTHSMFKSIKDKTDYILETDCNSFFDYGCADGSLLQRLYNERQPSKVECIGYDIDDKMIQEAKIVAPNCLFTDNLDRYGSFENTGLILSSVIHEVKNYDNIYKLYDFMFNSNFKYIFIRDMCCSIRNTYAPSDDYDKLMESIDDNLYRRATEAMGLLRKMSNFLQLLLKIPYSENYNKELPENYFGVTREDLLQVIKVIGKKYNIIYSKSYTPIWIKDRVLNDYNIDLNQIHYKKNPTHLKMILKRKQFKTK